MLFFFCLGHKRVDQLCIHWEFVRRTRASLRGCPYGNLTLCCLSVHSMTGVRVWSNLLVAGGISFQWGLDSTRVALATKSLFGDVSVFADDVILCQIHQGAIYLELMLSVKRLEWESWFTGWSTFRNLTYDRQVRWWDEASRGIEPLESVALREVSFLGVSWAHETTCWPGVSSQVTASRPHHVWHIHVSILEWLGITKKNRWLNGFSTEGLQS